ncbi:MAG: acetamidase/formamidase family protein, partial [Firmicutes bacterium]|nr:acetamidase/formamidase family protein [Bacillota bacterium]
MLRIPNSAKIDTMSSSNPPAACCQDGDTVIFETNDCFDGAVSPDGVRDWEGRELGKYMGNPATGPLYVEGAEPGDALCVEILDIQIRSWGAMGCGFGEAGFINIPGEYETRAFHYDDGFVKIGGKKIPISPMIGVIGVAPAGEGISTYTPDAHGGNMDCNRIVKGAKILFPVAAPGALLAMGDLHALMGDGEVFQYGLETSGEVTVRVSVIKNAGVKQPTLYQDGKAMIVASAKTYDDAIRLALESMFDLLVSHGWDRTEAGMLMSMKC